MRLAADKAEAEPIRDVDIIAVLKDWLEMAERGELRGVLLVGLGEGEFHRAWTGNWRLTETIGTLELAKHALIAESRE